MIEEMGFSVQKPIPLYVDNKGAIDLSRNKITNNRTKHIDIRHHFVRTQVENGNIEILKCASNDNKSDGFTKPYDSVAQKSFEDSLTSPTATID